MKTIREIANELGVSKTAVRKKIANLGISDKLETNGNQFLISETQETLIKSMFLKNKLETENRKAVCDKSESSRLVSTLIDTLQNELKDKNEIIKQQQETIKNLTAALLESQKTTHAAQTLHAANTMQLTGADQPEAQQTDVTDSGKKKKTAWWPWSKRYI